MTQLTPEEIQQRNQDMYNLRHIHGWSHTAIGKKYNISRERVAQCIGRDGRFFRRDFFEKKKASGEIRFKNYHEIDAAQKILKSVFRRDWGMERHSACGGNVAFGQKFEELTSELLRSIGIENKLMPIRHPYDIELCNGIRIDVKACRVDISKFKSQYNVYPCFQLPEMKSGKDCDFFVVWIPDEREIEGFTYFVIPSFEFYHLRRGSRSRIPWPQMGKKSSKWHKYHKALHLLKEKTNES